MLCFVNHLLFLFQETPVHNEIQVAIGDTIIVSNELKNVDVLFLYYVKYERA